MHDAYVNAIAGIIVIVVLLIPILLIRALVKRCSKASRMERRGKREFDAWLKRVQKPNGALFLETIEDPLFVLHDGEHLYWKAKNVQLIEGLSVSNVNFGSASVATHQKLQVVATGSLYITSRRLVFTGDFADCDIPLVNVVSMAADYTALEVHSSTYQQAMFFYGCSGMIARTMLQAMIKLSA